MTQPIDQPLLNGNPSHLCIWDQQKKRILRFVMTVAVSKDTSKFVVMMFGEAYSLAERIIREQFAF